MKKLLITATMSAMFVAAALPAAAAPGDTPATVTVTGGFLSISVPSGSAALGSIVNTMAGGTVSGSLGQVVVEDARSAAPGSGWVTSAISTAFTPATGPAIPASAVSYAAGGIAKVGTATYAANDRTGLTAAGPVVTATGITGDNSATWTPAISVDVAGGMAAAEYSATITHSVV